MIGPDVAERLHVRAAAQLERVLAGFEHAHDVAVLVAEERDGARRLGLAFRGLVGADAVVREHLAVREILDLLDLLGRDRVVVAEVEPQPVGRDERTRLLHVRTEHLAQRPVQEVRAGVVAADRVAALDVDRRDGLLARIDLALDDAGDVPAQARKGERRVAAPPRGRCRCGSMPVSPIWPPDSA